MQELLRSNDPVLLSFASALLADARIPAELFDLNASIADGSIGAIPRRIMVAEDDLPRARTLMRDAELLPPEPAKG